MAEKRYFLSAHSLFFTHTLVVVAVLAVAGSVTFDSGGGSNSAGHAGKESSSPSSTIPRRLWTIGGDARKRQDSAQKITPSPDPPPLSVLALYSQGGSSEIRPPVHLCSRPSSPSPPLPHPLAHQKTQMWPTLEYVRRRGGAL